MINFRPFWPRTLSILISAIFLVSTFGGMKLASARAATPQPMRLYKSRQLNTGTVINLPVSVVNLVAGRALTCALTSDQGVKCWGNNNYGQLGDGTVNPHFIPMDVSGLTNGVSAIAVGYDHACALTSSGGVKCWGRNNFGQLGDGTTTDQLTPVDVSGLTSGVSAIAAGEIHTCALTNEGGIKCWGGNWAGQLGNAANTDSSTPIDVVGLGSNISAITAGDSHTCALTSNGGVKCWGRNYTGELGNGTYDFSNIPTDVSELTSGVSAITARVYHTCALTSGGGIKCWGYNGYGQLGDDTYENRNTPVDVNGLTSGVDAISAGYQHTCALTTSGGGKCWGRNNYGQLGDGTTTDSLAPIDVLALPSGFSTIAAGEAHTCARTEGNGIKCWGSNWVGQLGDSTTTDSTSPVDVSGFSADFCGSGSWQPGNLEIHHINIGQGDSSLIVGPTGKSLLIDAGETNWNSDAKAQVIGLYIESVLGCKSLDYALISHFHLDHVGYVGYGGLWSLVETQGFSVGTTLVRDYNTYLGDISGTFTNWKTYLEGAGQAKLHPVLAVEGTGQVDLGTGVIFDIVAVDGNGAIIAGDFHGDAGPPSENDYSIGAVLSYGDFDEWLGGDMDGQYEIGGFGYTYHDIELSVAPEVGDVDVYKANHHGSSHSSSATFVNQLDPEVSIVMVGNGNTYGHPTQTTMDRLLATSTVYMTERGDTNTNIGSAIVAGNIVIKTSDGSSYTVNGTTFTATEPDRLDTDADGYFAEADPNDNSAAAIPAPNGGCGPIYQTCSVSCQAAPGQVLINEVLPAPSSGPEWVELYNTTASTLNIGYCYIDDIAAGSAAYQIPASTLIPAHGFWTLDRTTYFNNTGDEVRFLEEDGGTVLDSHSYGSTGSNLSWYRFPDGGTWAPSPTASITKGQSNNTPFPPIVLSSAPAGPNPTSASSVDFTVTFSEAVTGVNASAPFNDFRLTTMGVSGASIAAVSGTDSSYTVTVNTGSGSGTIRLDIVDDDSIKDASNNPLAGWGPGNGNFNAGEAYTILGVPAQPVLLFPPRNHYPTNMPSFSWNEVAYSDHYEIMFATDSGFAQNVASYFVAEPTFIFNAALADGKYYWRVRAYNIANQPGGWSSSRFFTIDTVPPSPPVLLSPANAAPSYGVATFRWSVASAAVRYQFQIDNDSDFSSPASSVIRRNIVRRSAGTLSGTYFWRVRAQDAAGNWSDWSETFTVEILPPR